MPAALTAFPLAIWEREGLVAALRKAGLPADDASAPGPSFWRFSRDDDVPVGFGGLELYAPDALLRSVVTLPPLRGRGIGSAIVSGLEAEARLAKCISLYLLTTTAQPLFERLGYKVIDRADAPPSIRASAQFRSLCPDSAALMMKRIG